MDRGRDDGDRSRRLVVAPGGTTAINVDLTPIDQGAYAGLATGVRVAVVGTIANNYNRVIAGSIARR